MLRRAAKRILPRRDAWHSLSTYTITDKDAAAWRDLRARDLKVESVLGRFSKDNSPEIDWKYWENSIAHRDIVACLKEFHGQQMSIIDKALAENHKEFVTSQKEGWDLFEDAVKSCEKSVEKSEEIMANGARALWISSRNPHVFSVSANAWIDSDQYWQSYIEKHNYYSSFVASGWDPEEEEYQTFVEKSFKEAFSKVHDRSDMPVMFKGVRQIHSWDYYDVYRRAFVEHMVYYLLRTGGDCRLFPEVPPWQWLTHIEDLRYKWLNVAQRRKAEAQMAGELRSVQLDLQPDDYEHGHGEHHYEHLIGHETETYELMAARWMGNYVLFSEPYVPVQTSAGLYRALAHDNGKGAFYSLGDDVNALFYLPAAEARTTPKPTEALHSLLDHLKLTGRVMNPGYATFAEIAAELVEQRGDIWLAAPGESTSQAFLRRLKSDEPARPVYEAYCKELEQRMAGKKEVPRAEVLKKVLGIEKKYQAECVLYDHLLHSHHHSVQEAARAEAERIAALKADDKLAKLVDQGGVVALDGARVLRGGELVAAVAEFSDAKDKVVEAVYNTKVPGLDGKK